MANPSSRVLILFAHPALQKSRVNIALADAVRDLERVRFHDLYEEYPDFAIDVLREKALLAEHDTIVLQHPLFWYSSPAILKEYQDLVLQHGWAYGRGGDALRGKCMLQAITTGGAQEAYRHDGMNRFTIGELLAPFAQTARLCGIEYLPPFVVYGSLRMTPSDIADHAARYRSVVGALAAGEVDREAIQGLDRINSERGLSALGVSGG